jgi:pimeloyl-ACP methyl ester carboxylesterase
MKKHIYCISGFGADERAFSKIDFGDNDVHFISWLLPITRESIQDYAKRMSKQIQHENPVLIGLSFGGMMCIEIAKCINTQLVILISSIKSFREIPLWMKLSAKTKLNKIFPLRSFKLIEPIENHQLGIENKEELNLVTEYRKNISPVYTNWAINEILNWKNDWQPANLKRIHGSKDRMFPIKYIKPDYVIEGGGHFMIMNRSKEINEIIKLLLR